jgi:hypothetical protein
MSTEQKLAGLKEHQVDKRLAKKRKKQASKDILKLPRTRRSE